MGPNGALKAASESAFSRLAVASRCAFSGERVGFGSALAVTLLPPNVMNFARFEFDRPEPRRLG